MCESAYTGSLRKSAKPGKKDQTLTKVSLDLDGILVY